MQLSSSAVITTSCALRRATMATRKLKPNAASGRARRKPDVPDLASATSAVGRSLIGSFGRSGASSDTIGELPRACYRLTLAGVNSADHDPRWEPPSFGVKPLRIRGDVEPLPARPPDS